MRVLGIDPGSGVTGWGVIERTAAGLLLYLASGTIRTRGCTTFADRLHLIYDRVRHILREWAPETIGLEKAFVGRNVQAAFRLGEARGAVLVGAAEEGIAVCEYAPAAVKLAVTGAGRADKEQVGRGVMRLLGVRERLAEDAKDALAVAICHAHAVRFSKCLQASVEQNAIDGGAGRHSIREGAVLPRRQRTRRGYRSRKVR